MGWGVWFDHVLDLGWTRAISSTVGTYQCLEIVQEVEERCSVGELGWVEDTVVGCTCRHTSWEQLAVV